MRNNHTTIKMAFLVIAGSIIFAFSFAWAGDGSFPQIEYTCDDGHGVRVTIDPDANVPTSVRCIYPDGLELNAIMYTNKTYLYAEVGEQEIPESPIHITNAGPQPGGAICTAGPPFYVYSDKMFRCYDRHFPKE